MIDKYKELIKLLRGCGAGKACKKCRREKDSLCMVHFMEEAADAIEELLQVQDQMGDDIAIMNEELLKHEWIPVSEGLPSAQPFDKDINVPTNDIISRQAAIDAIKGRFSMPVDNLIVEVIGTLPSAQPEPLTDKEQRIFLAAMGREMKVCEEVDRNYIREPYEDSLVRVCREIERKVKGALWT